MLNDNLVKKKMSSYSATLLSDTDDNSNTTQSNNSQKKRKSNVTADRSNKSHTSFFFRKDEDNPDLAYCQICEFNFSGTREKPYAYSRKGGNTTSIINHL